MARRPLEGLVRLQRGVMERSEIPGWLIRYLKIWGAQKRRIWLGRDWHGNIDGYSQSLVGKMLAEREAACTGRPAQKWAEVYLREGLEVQRALSGLPEAPYAVMHLHYVFDPSWGLTVSRKARILELDRTTYMKYLAKAQYFIWGRIEPGERFRNTSSQVIAMAKQIVSQALDKARKAA